MSRANVATYRIAGLTICSLLLFGCGGSYSGGGTPLIGDVTLSALSISGTTLVPAFSPSTFNYTATVPNGTISVDVFPTTTDSLATFLINGASMSNILLLVGDNIISIALTGQYGTAASVYTIVITRLPIVIDTTIGWDGQENLAPFGKGNIVTEGFEVYGQTFFTPPGAPTLTRLSFQLEHSPNDTSLEDVFFSVVVMAWNTDRATGSVLFESAIQNITTAQSTMTEYVFDTGGLTLTPGQEYVAFLSANNGFWTTTSTLVRVGFQNADIYPLGSAWILNTDNNLNLITTTAWTNPAGASDLVVIFAF